MSAPTIPWKCRGILAVGRGFRLKWLLSRTYRQQVRATSLRLVELAERVRRGDEEIAALSAQLRAEKR